jgi:hypothetical protein
VFAIIAVFEFGTCAASARNTCGSVPLVLAPPINNVGFRIDSASAFENGGRVSSACPIRVNALSRSCCLDAAGTPCPGAGTFDRIEEKLQAALDVAGRNFFRRRCDPRCERRGPGLRCGIERGVEFAAGFGENQPAQQIRPLLRDTKRDVSAAGMPHQIHRLGIQLFDEGDDVGDMLRDRIGVTGAVPAFGEKVPQGHRDYAVVLRQWPEHRRPGAKVAQRAVHAYQRPALAEFEIGHIGAVDVKHLHEGGSARQKGFNYFTEGRASP